MVYFIQSVEVKSPKQGARYKCDEGPVKIGYTEDPDLTTRIRDLRVGNPYPLRVLGVIAAGTYQNESRIHDLFASQRMQGEWFHYCESLRKFIRKYCTGYTLGTTYENVRPLPQDQFGLNAQNAKPATKRIMGDNIRRVKEAAALRAPHIARVVELYESGISGFAIARQLKIPQGRVYRILTDAKVVRRAAV